MSVATQEGLAMPGSAARLPMDAALDQLRARPRAPFQPLPLNAVRDGLRDAARAGKERGLASMPRSSEYVEEILASSLEPETAFAMLLKEIEEDRERDRLAKVTMSERKKPASSPQLPPPGSLFTLVMRDEVIEEEALGDETVEDGMDEDEMGEDEMCVDKTPDKQAECKLTEEHQSDPLDSSRTGLSRTLPQKSDSRASPGSPRIISQQPDSKVSPDRLSSPRASPPPQPHDSERNIVNEDNDDTRVNQESLSLSGCKEAPQNGVTDQMVADPQRHQADLTHAETHDQQEHPPETQVSPANHGREVMPASAVSQLPPQDNFRAPNLAKIEVRRSAVGERPVRRSARIRLSALNLSGYRTSYPEAEQRPLLRPIRIQIDSGPIEVDPKEIEPDSGLTPHCGNCEAHDNGYVSEGPHEDHDEIGTQNVVKSLEFSPQKEGDSVVSRKNYWEQPKTNEKPKFPVPKIFRPPDEERTPEIATELEQDKSHEIVPDPGADYLERGRPEKETRAEVDLSQDNEQPQISECLVEKIAECGSDGFHDHESDPGENFDQESAGLFDEDAPAQPGDETVCRESSLTLYDQHLPDDEDDETNPIHVSPSKPNNMTKLARRSRAGPPRILRNLDCSPIQNAGLQIENGVRRSKRPRHSPLKFWMPDNTIVYQREKGKARTIFQVAEVVKGSHGPSTPPIAKTSVVTRKPGQRAKVGKNK